MQTPPSPRSLGKSNWPTLSRLAPSWPQRLPAAVKPLARAKASWPAPMKPTLMVSGGLRPLPSQLAPSPQEQLREDGQNPEQEVRRTVPGLATPPPTGDPHPSGSNSPPLRCPRPPQRPDLLLRVPDRGQRGVSQPPERVGKRHGVGGRPHARIPSPRPRSPRSEPPRRRRRVRGLAFPSARRHHRPPEPNPDPQLGSQIPSYSVRVSPCPQLRARHAALSAGGAPPPQPIRGAAALELANLGAREAPRGSCIIRSPRPLPLGPVAPALPNLRLQSRPQRIETLAASTRIPRDRA